MSNSTQFSEPFETILNLLAIAVLVDEKERDKELVEFYFCASLHNQRLHPDQIVTPAQIRNWYNERKSFIASMLRNEGAQNFEREMLSRIGDKGLQRQILISIFDISVADYDLATVETDYIKLALEVWEEPLPNSSEIKVYA